MTAASISINMGGAAFHPYNESRFVCEHIVQTIVNRALGSVESQQRERIRSLSSPLTPVNEIVFPESSKGLMVKLRELSISNREFPITEHQKREIHQEVNNLMRGASDLDLLLLMKIIAQNTTSISLEMFVIVLQQLKLQHPELNEYLLGKDPILTVKSVDKLIEIFENQFGFEKGIITTQSEQDIPELINENMQSLEDCVKGWIVYNPDPEDPHLVSLFFQKKENQCSVFICNSVGHNIHFYAFQPLILKTIIEKAYKFPDFLNLKIYSYKCTRQNDGVSCPVFSLLDLKNIYEGSQKGRDIFEFLQSNGNPKNIMPKIQDDSDLQLYEVDKLPPDMMKATQSYNQLKFYRIASPTFNHIPVSFIRMSPAGKMLHVIQDEDLLERKLQCYQCVVASDGTRRNKYIERKRLDWIVLVISNLFSSEQ